MDGKESTLERRSFQARRMRDIALLLPFLSAILFAFPLALIFLDDGEDAGRPVALYLFFSWMGLIALSAVLSRRMKRLGMLDQ